MRKRMSIWYSLSTKSGWWWESGGSKHQRTCFWSIFLLVFHRPEKLKIRIRIVLGRKFKIGQMLYKIEKLGKIEKLDKIKKLSKKRKSVKIQIVEKCKSHSTTIFKPLFTSNHNRKFSLSVLRFEREKCKKDFFTCRSISSRDSSVAMGASNADLNSQDSVTSATELMLEWRLVDCGRACWPLAPSLTWNNENHLDFE